ncbi:hypothetical protein EDC01DRAFT_630990 [Geopyxis carbonaria]|nr:hypothetical protein EDC01DRAFT_630990 [Geopyxis carbonaria]
MSPPTPPTHHTLEDASYLASTQHRFFTFTPAALAEQRRSTNALALGRVAALTMPIATTTATATATGEEGTATDTPAGTPAGTLTGSSLASSGLAGSDITPADELLLLRYYASQLLKICTHFSVSSPVRATALTFLHRLYLRLSPITAHPKTLLLPLLFLALKCESGGQSTSWFVRTAAELGLKTTKAELLAPEVMVAMNLRWSFAVRHPWRAVEGVKAELTAALDNEAGVVREGAGGERPAGVDRKRILAACGEARQLLTMRALETDVAFLFTPPQQTLGALHAADAALAQWYVALKLPAGGTRDKLLATIAAAASYLDGSGAADAYGGLIRVGGEEVAQADAARVDKKIHLLKKAMAAASDVGGAKREAEREREEEERRRKKRKVEEGKLRRDLDVFGEDLRGDASAA